MLPLLIKSSACLAIFLLFYKLLLEKENMHHIKRFYLLGALLASFIIPSTVFTEYVEVTQHLSLSETPTIINDFETPSPKPIDKATGIDWETILWGIYAIGVIGFGLRFLSNLGQIWWRIRKNPKLRDYSITRVLLLQQLPPHTFFSYIFLNKKQYEAHNIPEEVLLHEETHARQRHSLDVLLVELAQVLLWFNPLIYLLKSSIRLNHEFLADSAIIKDKTNIPKYQKLLLSFLSNARENNNQSIKIANAIVYSSIRAERKQSIKKRFTVMKTNTSKKSIVLRSFLLIPLIALLLLGFSERKEVPKPSNSAIEITNYTARSLSIYIKENGNYLVEGKKANKDNFVKVINQFNKDIKPEIRNKILNIHLTSSNEIPNSEVWFIYNSVLEYGFYRIVAPNQEIIREKGNTPFAIEKEAGQEDLETYNRLAKKYNAVSIEERKISLKDLKVLETIYRNMDEAQKQNAQPFPECLPQNDTQKTVNLIEININNNGQLLVQDELVKLEDLELFLSKINRHLSFDERKKTVRSIIKVDTKTPKDVIQKVDEILTEYGCATINIIGREYSTKSTPQQSATREEMKEYNSLAKKYNEMDRENMIIKKKEVMRLKVLYGKMSKKQQSDAEPFPDFPKPPPVPEAPKPPKNVSDTEYALNQIENIVEKQDPYDVVGGSISTSLNKLPGTPISPTYVKDIEPTTPPPPPNPIEHMEELAEEGAEFMLNGTPISAEKALEVVKSNKRINIDLRESTREKTLVKLSVDPIQIKN